MRDADEELPGRAPGDDPSAFDVLIERHLPALRAYVRLNVPADVRARESCSDLVQSVCLEVWGARDGFEYRGPEAFRAWLFHWALHKIKDRAKYHRADKRAAGHEAGGVIHAGTDTDTGPGPGNDLAALYATIGTPSAAAIAHEDAALLERAFDALADDDRQVIGMCRIAGLPRDEVARVLGKSAGAVRTHLSRALVRLAGVLEELGVQAGRRSRESRPSRPAPGATPLGRRH